MKQIKNKQMNLIEGSIIDKIVYFALPVAFSSVLQQLFNSADAAVVGQFAGAHSLAAVGANGPIVSLLVNLFAGLSVGVNVVVANYIGAKNNEKIKQIVNAAIPLAILLGVVLTIIGILLSVPMHNITHTPDNVFNLAVLYLEIYFLGMPFILLYNYGSAVLRSKGDAKRPFFALTIAGIINVLLNLLLVIVFNMGVAGVAIATVVSNIFSASLVFYFLFTEDEPFNVNFKLFNLGFLKLKSILTIGLPAGLQGAVFSISNIVIQSTINSFGSYVMAGVAAAITFENISYFMSSAFAVATVTFISQNYAACKYERCKKIFNYSILLGISLSFITGMLFYIFSDKVLNIMTSDPLVKIEAVRRMKTVTLFVCLSTFYEVSGAVLRGLGHSAIPAIMVVFGTCVFRIIWISTVCVHFHLKEYVYVVYPISWTITSICTFIAYLFFTKKMYTNN